MRPVIGLDIDGTLLAYHPHFVRFARDWLGDDGLDPYGYDARQPLHQYLGVSKAMYRRCKLAYRRGELKRSLLPLDRPYPQARELTHQLRRKGFDIWLCTTRPYLSHDTVDEATRHNLRRNGVLYQGIIWGQHKYRELVRTVGAERVVGVLDDLPEMCNQATSLGLRTAFAVREHNQQQLLTFGVSGVYPWALARTHDDTINLFDIWLKEWQQR
jgi:phosphoglycolate phosphatase-like HAD superfamily hydrolase